MCVCIHFFSYIIIIYEKQIRTEIDIIMFSEKPQGEGHVVPLTAGGTWWFVRQDGTGGDGPTSQRRCCVPRSVPSRTRIPRPVVDKYKQ